jgi:hypothetical protein
VDRKKWTDMDTEHYGIWAKLREIRPQTCRKYEDVLWSAALRNGTGTLFPKLRTEVLIAASQVLKGSK